MRDVYRYMQGGVRTSDGPPYGSIGHPRRPVMVPLVDLPSLASRALDVESSLQKEQKDDKGVCVHMYMCRSRCR